MGIAKNPTPRLTPAHLREQARILGVEVTDEDLVAVDGFLAAVLPALAELEDGLGAADAPTDLRPDPE
jgi:hypothetical protein